jgi:TonB family protein
VISERLFGTEHRELAPLLNELSRLHIQRSQFARAEDALKRLLATARIEGEENADAATALAGLAVVQRKLGDDAAAEALYRDAVRIREKVLEPNNMVTVVTLEQLSETCAARGNFAEALALLRRALSTREVVLGPGHATVQVARSRVAKLELQVAVAADGAVAAGLKAVREMPSPINSRKPEFLREPEDRVLRPAVLSPEGTETPTVGAAVAAASLVATSIYLPSASQIVVSPPENTRPSRSITGRESGISFRDAALADAERRDVASDHAALDDSRSTIAPVPADSPEPAHEKRTALYSSAGVAAVAIAIAGLLILRLRASGGSDPDSRQIGAAQRTTVAGGIVATGAAPPPTAPPVQPKHRTSEVASPGRLPTVDVHLSPIDVPIITVPTISAAASLDSIAVSATERPRASDTDRTGTREKVSSPKSADDDDAITPPKITGRVPEPRFPEAALRSGQREGQVVVRFVVNELGTVDVASMIVEQSDHELFTSAVRDILPSFRFEPARTRAPQSKPVAAWVTVPFRFTTKKK